MSKKEMQSLIRANSDNGAPFNYKQSQSYEKNIGWFIVGPGRAVPFENTVRQFLVKFKKQSSEFEEFCENVHLLNFVEDEFDRLAEQNTSQSTLSSVSLAQKPSFNSRFNGSCALLTTLGLASCILHRLSTVTSSGGLVLLFLFVIFMREWHRVYGNWLSRKKRAYLSYRSILKNNSNFIPCYDLQWLFGDKYAGYAYGCCLGDELTEEQPDNYSPPYSPVTGEIR